MSDRVGRRQLKAAVIFGGALLILSGLFPGGGSGANGRRQTPGRAMAQETGEEAETDRITERAQDILDSMTMEEKAGQMFIARCPQESAPQKAAEYHLGGYILFGQDFAGRTEEEVIRDIESCQEAVQIPLFIGVDEEGGTVNRVSTNPNLRAAPFWSPQKLYKKGGFPLICSDAREKCELLRSLGINLNFAPVCDISQNPKEFIYKRSFGQGAEQTALHVQSVVETMGEESMGSL